MIKHSLFDLASIRVYSIKNQFICTAKRVESTHPMAYHLGEIKDIEDFKQKIQRQKKLKNKTLKGIKNFLPKEDIQFIEAEINKKIIGFLASYMLPFRSKTSFEPHLCLSGFLFEETD